ncbi:MAG: ribonuclease HI family protein [Patescibacteria group bacterium]
MEEKVLKVFTDGGSRGNPGPAAAGVYITLGEQEVFKGGKYLGETTNNIAEYKALVLAVNWVLSNFSKHSVKEVLFTMDSELIVKQIKGEYKVKDEKLKEHYIFVNEKLSQLKLSGVNYQFRHVKRHENKVADKVVNQILDKSSRGQI